MNRSRTIFSLILAASLCIGCLEPLPGPQPPPVPHPVPPPVQPVPVLSETAQAARQAILDYAIVCAETTRKVKGLPRIEKKDTLEREQAAGRMAAFKTVNALMDADNSDELLDELDKGYRSVR